MYDNAFATFLMLNDSYLPGALLLGYELKKQKVHAELVCMVTEQISDEAKRLLSVIFNCVIDIPSIYVPHKRRQQRQDRPYMFTRFNALRLGKDGNLRYNFKKVVMIDADVLPIKNYEELLYVTTPAGVLNENRSKFFNSEEKNRSKITKWSWHEAYDCICPHGQPIPAYITDRVANDSSNMGLNGSLFVFEPSIDEFNKIIDDIKKPEILELVGDKFDWPDMQYITMKWSGRWHCIDIKFCGFNGYPNLKVLNGTHFAGIKPWYFRRNLKAVENCSRFEDFKLWYREYFAMIKDYPELGKAKKLKNLLEEIKNLKNF